MVRLSRGISLRSKRCYAVFMNRHFEEKRVICAKLDHFLEQNDQKGGLLNHEESEKVLSLVLALAMALSLMTAASPRRR